MSVLFLSNPTCSRDRAPSLTYQLSHLPRPPTRPEPESLLAEVKPPSEQEQHPSTLLPRPRTLTGGRPDRVGSGLSRKRLFRPFQRRNPIRPAQSPTHECA